MNELELAAREYDKLPRSVKRILEIDYSELKQRRPRS